jgi:hypothetical protein
MKETIMEMHEYVERVPGINLGTRRKMQRAFESDNAASELDALINESPENHIQPEVRQRLNEYWNENFTRK